MDTLQRIEGALVGLAVAEALGVALTEVHAPGTPLVAEPHFPARDGTDQVVVVSHAALAVPHGTRAEGAWHAALLREFTLDDDDRLVQRASSTTARRAIAHLRHDGLVVVAQDSDGATAALRALPVGWILPPRAIHGGAKAAATLFHGHPTAVEAAILVAWTSSLLVRGVPLQAGLVRAGRVLVEKLALGGALDAVLAEVPDVLARYGGRLPEALSEGDLLAGGPPVRSGGAVGYALAAALLAGAPGPDAWERAVVAAARLPGDSHLVAGLVGAWLGAAWGFRAIPASLVNKLEDRDALVDLARALHLRAEGMDWARRRSGEELGGLGWTSDPPGHALPLWLDPTVEDATLQEWD